MAYVRYLLAALGVGVSAAGLAVAGYSGLYEILIETLLIFLVFVQLAWTIQHAHGESRRTVPPILESLRKGRLYTAFTGGKQELLDHLLAEQKPVLAAAKVMAFGILFGCALCLIWLPTKGVAFTVSREIKEIGLDVVVLAPLLYTSALWLAPFYQELRVGVDPTDYRQTGQDYPFPVPPADPIAEYADMHGAAHQASRREGSLLWSHTAVAILICIVSTAAYVWGHHVAKRQPIEMLSDFAQWSI